MKKEKGFTLIELLAVIVILAIIALIATPTILGVIETARKGAAESSALGYIDAIEKQIIISEVDETTKEIKDGTYHVPMNGISVKGESPLSGWVVITKGQVANYSFVINEYVVTKDEEIKKGKEAISKPSGSNVIYQTGTTNQVDVIYYNPEINTSCKASESISTTGTKTGCMKWYVIADSDESSNTVDIILDHNTTSLVAWNSSGNNIDGMNEIVTTLINDISTWHEDVKETARLITADEIANITSNINWDSTDSTAFFYFDDNSQIQTSTSKGESQYSWLFDYTSECSSFGCNIEDSSNYGYWTSTPVRSNYAWYIDRKGYLGNRTVADNEHYGIRPVITIDKSNI